MNITPATDDNTPVHRKTSTKLPNNSKQRVHIIILYRNAFMIKQMLKAGTPAPAAAAYGRTINRLATLT